MNFKTQIKKELRKCIYKYNIVKTRNIDSTKLHYCWGDLEHSFIYSGGEYLLYTWLPSKSYKLTLKVPQKIKQMYYKEMEEL